MKTNEHEHVKRISTVFECHANGDILPVPVFETDLVLDCMIPDYDPEKLNELVEFLRKHPDNEFSSKFLLQPAPEVSPSPSNCSCRDEERSNDM